MLNIHALVRTSIVTVVLLAAAEARADWTLWVEGLPQGISPSIAISEQREIFYTFLAPNFDGNGVVHRASLDDPQRVFTMMPTFPLPELQQDVGYNNAMALTINARGEPVVGLSINGNWINMSPLIMTWDSDADSWIAAAIVPEAEVCTNMGNVAGVGVLPDGRVIVQGGDGNAPYPPAGTLGLYVFDLVARASLTPSRPGAGRRSSAAGR